MQSHAQLRPQYRMHSENQLYYFGITLGYNSSYLQLNRSPNFLNDSILSAYPKPSGGITMGLLATARMTDHFQARFNPQLMIGGGKAIKYILGNKRLPGENIEQLQVLPSTMMSFPLQIKFNSDRIDNFRAYLLGGVKFDIDLSNSATSRNAEDIIKIKKYDVGLEAGIGINLYLPFVTISPEIKISYGLSDIHKIDPALKYSNVFDKLQSRMIVFSIHLED